MRKCGMSAVLLAAVLLVASSCRTAFMVPAGNYYLNGDTDSRYIQIIDDKSMRFVSFDIEYLTSYLIYEGTGFTGQEAEGFKARHNLPNAFAGEIGYDYDTNDKGIYINALFPNQTDAFVANFRAVYESKNSIIFMESTYIRK